MVEKEGRETRDRLSLCEIKRMMSAGFFPVIRQKSQDGGKKSQSGLWNALRGKLIGGSPHLLSRDVFLGARCSDTTISYKSFADSGFIPFS